MWIGGISQGLFWRALDADGFLKYPDFVEGLLASRCMYHMRLIGGSLFFLSFLLGIVNLVDDHPPRQQGHRTRSTVPALAPSGPSAWKLLFGAPGALRRRGDHPRRAAGRRAASSPAPWPWPASRW